MIHLLSTTWQWWSNWSRMWGTTTPRSCQFHISMCSSIFYNIGFIVSPTLPSSSPVLVLKFPNVFIKPKHMLAKNLPESPSTSLLPWPLFILLSLESESPIYLWPRFYAWNNGSIIVPGTLINPFTAKSGQFKFPLQPRQKHYITQSEDLGFSLLTQMEDD